MIIHQAEKLRGNLRLPGDKSITHRAAFLAALAAGTSTITNFASGADCRSTIDCLRALGIDIGIDGDTVRVTGSGKRGLRPPHRELDCGNSGTTMRLLAGILAGQDFNSVLTGDASLRQRPMMRILDPLYEMGASIESDNGRAPLRIRGGRRLKGIRHRPAAASAQVKSCVLLAGLSADGETTIVESTPTRDHTERMLPEFGAVMHISDTDDGREILITGGAELSSTEIDVPGDPSSAAFFIAASACLPGSELSLSDVGLNPLRTAFIDILRRAGASISISGERTGNREPRGDINVAGGLIRDASTDILLAGDAIAKLIDEIPVLAVIGTQIGGGLEVRDASELRMKECDRIAAVVENLRRMGARVDEFDDGFRVHRSTLTGAPVDSFGDHRIAMSFAVAGLLASGETEIKDAECVDVSFPGFFKCLCRLTTRSAREAI